MTHIGFCLREYEEEECYDCPCLEECLEFEKEEEEREKIV